MANELKRSKCIEEINLLAYHASPNLLTSGRYIKALRNYQNIVKNDNEKMKLEYLINRHLHKHIVFLQEAIINSYNKKPEIITINKEQALKFKQMAKSDYAISDTNMSIIDIEGMKKLETIKKSVVLKNTMVLPCKIKSENQKYKFNTQIIMTKNNVLGYASYSYDYDSKTNHNIMIHKLGKGIKNNDLLTKKKVQITR